MLRLCGNLYLSAAGADVAEQLQRRGGSCYVDADTSGCRIDNQDIVMHARAFDHH